MNRTEKVDRKEVVVVNRDDFLFTSRMIGKRVYLAAYVVIDGSGYYVDPDMAVDMWCLLLSYSDSAVTVCSVGTLFNIVPLESRENLEEGISGDVLFYYQVLLDDGRMVLVSSLAFSFLDVRGLEESNPSFQEWLAIKLGNMEKVCS